MPELESPTNKLVLRLRRDALSRLRDQAAKLGLETEEYAVRVLTDTTRSSSPSNGAHATATRVARFRAAMREIAKSATGKPSQVDASRESMYP